MVIAPLRRVRTANALLVIGRSAAAVKAVARTGRRTIAVHGAATARIATRLLVQTPLLVATGPLVQTTLRVASALAPGMAPGMATAVRTGLRAVRASGQASATGKIVAQATGRLNRMHMGVPPLAATVLTGRPRASMALSS